MTAPKTPPSKTAARKKRDVSPEERARQLEALAAGRAKRDANREAAKANPQPTRKEKWAMLESGELKVEDMDDEELKRGEFRNKHGQFGGKPSKVPSKHVKRMMDERIRRARVGLNKLLPKAIDVAEDLLTSEDDRVRHSAANMVFDRVMGRPEAQVSVTIDASWDKLAEAIERDL